MGSISFWSANNIDRSSYGVQPSAILHPEVRLPLARKEHVGQVAATSSQRVRGCCQLLSCFLHMLLR